MDMVELHRAQERERVFERRAARTRRAKWLGGLLFSGTGMALMLVLRTNPDLADTIVAWSHGTDVPPALRTVEKPADIHVRAMPSDVVPVRRGGTPINN